MNLTLGAQVLANAGTFGMYTRGVQRATPQTPRHTHGDTDTERRQTERQEKDKTKDK